MSLLAFLFIGLVAGLIARALLPGTQAMGIFATTGLGLVGSFVGGLISTLVSSDGHWLSLHPTGLIFSVVGAMVVLAIFGLGSRGARIS